MRWSSHVNCDQSRLCTTHLALGVGDQGGSAVIGIQGLEHAEARVADIAQGGAQKQAHDQNDQNGEINVMRHDISPVPLPLTRAPGGYQGAGLGESPNGEGVKWIS